MRKTKEGGVTSELRYPLTPPLESRGVKGGGRRSERKKNKVRAAASNRVHVLFLALKLRLLTLRQMLLLVMILFVRQQMLLIRILKLY